MSMTQGIVDELRTVADELSVESTRVAQSDQWAMAHKLNRWAALINDCADDLGDD